MRVSLASDKSTDFLCKGDRHLQAMEKDLRAAISPEVHPSGAKAPFNLFASSARLNRLRKKARIRVKSWNEL
jgi:hypothetical protein